MKHQRRGKQDTYAVEEVQYNPKPNTKKQCRKPNKQKITTKIKTKTAGKNQLTPCIQNSLDDLIGDCHFELGEDGAGDVGVLVGVPANHFFFCRVVFWCEIDVWRSRVRDGCNLFEKSNVVGVVVVME